MINRTQTAISVDEDLERVGDADVWVQVQTDQYGRADLLPVVSCHIEQDGPYAVLLLGPSTDTGYVATAVHRAVLDACNHVSIACDQLEHREA